MKNLTTLSFITLAIVVFSCKNRDINEGEAFRPREIHEDIMFHFDMITVDGIEYLILEKDNNNPHEGFGFMAFRANKLMEKQDTIMAYMKTLHELQVRTLAAASRRPLSEVENEADELFEYYLNEKRVELESLHQKGLKSDKEANSSENKTE